MARQRHNAAFVVGSILGGVAGAAAALWKTPQSGAELRSRVSERLGGFAGSGGSSAAEPRSTAGGSGVGGKLLSFAEKAAAPIVGVKLGQTANHAGSEAAGRVRPGERGTAPPGEERMTAAYEATGETSEAGPGHVASTEELVKPTVPVETQSTAAGQASGPFTAFPEFQGDDSKNERM